MIAGTIRAHQERRYPVGSPHDLKNPDFVAFARSFGIACRAGGAHEDFAGALDRARNAGDRA